MFFALLTLKALNNSRFRNSLCIWNISGSLILLVSRQQPKIAPCQDASQVVAGRESAAKILKGYKDVSAAMGSRRRGDERR